MNTSDKKHALTDHLIRAILTQDLAPGAELDEAALCDAFDLSRTPVRDVFRDLAGLGYIRVRDTRGARVSDLSHQTLRDFFLAAPMMYGAILRLAAHNATDRQITDLKAAQTRFRKALRDGSAADRTLANHRFHQITGDMAGNIYLQPSFDRLLIDHARIGLTFYRPRNNKSARTLTLASDQHDAIIAAIETGDETAAAALADDHWALSRHEIERFVMPDSLDVALGWTATDTRGAS